MDKSKQNVAEVTKPEKINPQVRRSREWMMEALLLLMDTMPYDKITISDITKKAGLARQTFYRNYSGKDDIILQYLDSVFTNDFFTITDGRDETGRYVMKVTLSFRSIIKERQRMVKLPREDTEHLLIAYTQRWEDYVIDFGGDKVSPEEKLLFRYKVKFQVGGAFRMIVDWIKNDMPMPPDEVGDLLQKFVCFFETAMGSLPYLILRIQHDEVPSAPVQGRT
jgi:AcrR family transcriptional regulator